MRCTTGAPKLINSDLFLEKHATVPIKTQGVQRSSSGKIPRFETRAISSQILDDNKQFVIDQGYNNISHQTDTFIWHNPL